MNEENLPAVSLSPNPMTVPIVACASIITCLTIAAITLVSMYHPGDNTQLITSIIGFATVSVTSLMAFLKSVGNGEHLKSIDVKVDSRLSQLLAASGANVPIASGTTTATPTVEPPKP